MERELALSGCGWWESMHTHGLPSSPSVGVLGEEGRKGVGEKRAKIRGSKIHRDKRR
jgi:hypothetical protein